MNGYSFPSIFFLIIFGLLWYRQAQFDTDFFIIAFVLISYLRHTYLRGFAASCVDLLQYWVAVQRIQVEIFIFVFFILLCIDIFNVPRVQAIKGGLSE